MMKISIITPTNNSSKTIKRTLESVLIQTYQNIQHIIIDNLSKDGTVNIVKSYRKKYENKGKQLIFLSESDNGLYDAINKGVKLSSGTVLGVLSSNDFYYSKYSIEHIFNSITNHKVDCVYGDLLFKAGNRITRKWISKDFTFGDFYKSWTPAHPTFYYKKILHERYGFYRTDYKIASDVDFMYRLLEINKVSSKYINEYLVIMSNGGLSNSGISSKIQITKEMLKTFRENNKKASIFRYLIFKLLKIKEMRI